MLAAGARLTIALKIGKLIARANSSCLTHLNKTTGTKSIWEEVHRLTHAAVSTKLPDSITPTMLNNHYSATSTEQLYNPLLPRHYPLPPDTQVKEYQVFRMLDTLQQTATGPDAFHRGISEWVHHFSQLH